MIRKEIKFHSLSLFVLFFSLCLLSISKSSFSQFSKPIFVNRGDTIIEEILSEDVSRWKVNKENYVYRFNFRTEIWSPICDYSLLQLGARSNVWTIPNAFRLWYSEEGLAVWEYDKQQKDWLRHGFAPQIGLVDSFNIWRVNDTICFSHNKEGQKIWKVDTDVVYWEKEIIGNYNTWQINDTASFWKVDSMQHLHIYQDSTELWKLDEHPTRLTVSKNTSIWTLLPNIELWKAGNKINVWSFDKARKKWKVNNQIKQFRKANKQKLWVIDENIKVLSINNDSVQIWRRVNKEKVWSLSPKIRVWHYVPPSPPPPIPDSNNVQIPADISEKIKLLHLSKQRKAWVIDPQTTIWQFEQHNELWKKLDQIQTWHMDDSTDVWLINKSYQVTRIGKRFRFWQMNNKANIWKEIHKPKYWQINDTTQVWWFAPKMVATAYHSKLSVWDVSKTLQIIHKDAAKTWVRNDTIQYWQNNDSTLLQIQHPSKNGELWKRKEYVKLPVSDSLFFWRINDSTRVSQLRDSVTLWKLRKTWITIDSVSNFQLNDTTRIWESSPDFQIWQGKSSLNFWQKANKDKAIRLRDSIQAWFYYRAENATTSNEKSNWKFSGHLKVNSYQNQIRNWAQGGESTVSFQTETRTNLKYEQKYWNWDSWAELKYGVTIRGDKPMQKSEDKIEIDSRLNYKTKDRWNYTLHSKIKTQFTEGRDYNLDQKVSDFISPLYINIGFGTDYKIGNLFSLYLSPITAKLTYVNDTATVNQTKFGIDEDKKTLNQTGAYINGNLNLNLSKSIRIESRFSLFSNYFDQPENIDIDWLAKLILNVNKYINSEISFRLIYDDDIQIPIYQSVNGEQKKIAEGPRLQMQETFKVGFQINF